MPEHSSDFLSCKVFNCFAQFIISICKLSKKKEARQPFQFKIIVKYDSTASEMSYRGNIELQSEASFYINFQVKVK